jgi:protein involved in polysaccharide export with SLBB domain
MKSRSRVVATILALIISPVGQLSCLAEPVFQKPKTAGTQPAQKYTTLIPPPPPIEYQLGVPLEDTSVNGALVFPHGLQPSFAPGKRLSLETIKGEATTVHQQSPTDFANVGREGKSDSRKEIAQNVPALPADEPPDVTAADMTLLSADYRLGPGDVLLITDPDLGTPESPSSTPVTVGPDGKIMVYGAGVVKAAGRTVDQVAAIINQLAKENNDNPRITATLLKRRPINVYVLGDVASPGLWNPSMQSATESEKNRLTDTVSEDQNPRAQAISLLTAGNVKQTQVGPPDLKPPTQTEPTPKAGDSSETPFTALAALQLAGGIRETGDIRHIVVRQRSAGTTRIMDLWKLLAEGDFDQDVVLQPGDIVYVPTGGAPFASEKLGLAANQFKYVRVWGEVRQPGVYILTPKDDLMSIIGRAGGFTPNARTGVIEISRMNRNGTLTNRFVSIQRALRGVDAIGRQPIQSGDVIIAKTNLMKKYGPAIANHVFLGMSAILFLYISRNIVDRTQSNTQSLRLF